MISMETTSDNIPSIHIIQQCIFKMIGFRRPKKECNPQHEPLEVRKHPCCDVQSHT